MTNEQKPVAPPNDVGAQLDGTVVGLELRRGEFVLPYDLRDSTTDGATRLEQDGLHVKLQVYNRDLGDYVTFVGLLTPATAATDLKDAMVDAGLVEDGGATGLNLDGGDLTANEVKADTLAVAETSAFTGDVTMAGTLAVTGAGTFADTLAVTGGSTFNAAITATDINFTGNLDGSATSDLWIRDATIEGSLNHTGGQLGFFNASTWSKLNVTGSRGGNAALASLLTELARYGLITNSTS